MTSAVAFRRFALAYGTAFAPLYAIAKARGLSLFTVYPSFGIVLLGMHRSRDVADPAMDFLAPEMWWYGWTATATLGSLVIGSMAALSPARLVSPVLVRVGVGGSSPRDDGMRLPDYSLVSTIAFPPTTVR